MLLFPRKIRTAETTREVRSATTKRQTSLNFDKSHIICTNAFPKDLPSISFGSRLINKLLDWPSLTRKKHINGVPVPLPGLNLFTPKGQPFKTKKWETSPGTYRAQEVTFPFYVFGLLTGWCNFRRTGCCVQGRGDRADGHKGNSLEVSTGISCLKSLHQKGGRPSYLHICPSAFTPHVLTTSLSY